MILDRVLGFLTAAACFLVNTSVLADSERKPVKSLLEFRQDQVVVQNWDLSCGAATLATLLAYQLNDPVPERDIATSLINRQEYIDQPWLVRAREGFSLLDLKTYMDQRGYLGVGLGRLTLKDLEDSAPVIVPLNLHGYNHFVVFRGRVNNRVLLADPAWGNRTLSVSKFEDAWIKFPKFGNVGFIVKDQSGKQFPNNMAPRVEDFVNLK